MFRNVIYVYTQADYSMFRLFVHYNFSFEIIVYYKGKGKVRPRTGHEGPEGE